MKQKVKTKKSRVNGKQSKELLRILSHGGYSYDELLKAFSGTAEELNLTIEKLLKKDDIKELRFENNNVYFLDGAETFLEWHSLDYRPIEKTTYENVDEKEREQKFKVMTGRELEGYFDARVQFKKYLSEQIPKMLRKSTMTLEEMKRTLKISDAEKEEVLNYMLNSLKFLGQIKEIKMENYSIYFKE